MRRLATAALLVTVLAGCGHKSGTATATPDPTLTQGTYLSRYPPITKTDLRGLAADGDASDVHQIGSDTISTVPGCPQQRRLVTLSSDIKDRLVAQDMLAYYFAQNL